MESKERPSLLNHPSNSQRSGQKFSSRNLLHYSDLYGTNTSIPGLYYLPLDFSLIPDRQRNEHSSAPSDLSPLVIDVMLPTSKSSLAFCYSAPGEHPRPYHEDDVHLLQIVEWRHPVIFQMARHAHKVLGVHKRGRILEIHSRSLDFSCFSTFFRALEHCSLRTS